MKRVGTRGTRSMVLLALLVVSLALYAAAESNVAGAEAVLLGVLVRLMVITVKVA